jgi:pimeloyl-ACP methyl ester carboxylesterase
MKALFAMVVIGLGLAPAIADPPADRKAGEVVIEKASLAAPGTDPVQYELGTLYVPENRGDPKSRIIAVGFARFRAVKPTGAPPTFHLPGGPGGSYLTPLTASQPSRSFAAYVEHFRSVGDVVLVDQRGHSQRGELLKFNRRTQQPLDQPASLARHTADFVEAARVATADFAKKGVDLRGYTVKECADDVNDLRKALGYERITLVGVSFGSQWSFAVLRRHPGTVERALLGGVEPLDCGYDMPSHVLAAVRRLWYEAEKDSRLQPYLPPGGLTAAAQQFLKRLEGEPLRVELTDERTRKQVTVVLGPEDFQRHFLPLAANPAYLLSLYHGRSYDNWARVVLRERRDGSAEVPLIGPLIDTSLGVTPMRGHLLRTDPAASLLGQWNFDSYLSTADVWPSPDVGDDFRTPVLSDVPVVFVHGDWDTSTPVENLLEVAPYFPKGRTILVEHGEHGALPAVLQQRPAVRAALLEFLKTGTTEKLPARISLPVPKFAVPNFPPPASTENPPK